MAERVIVSQIGARHRYLIPRVLEKNRLLYRLYTDSTRYSVLGRLSQFMLDFGFETESAKRLVNRDPNISHNKIYTSDLLFFKRLINSIWKNHDSLNYSLPFTGMGKVCERWGIGKADCVYGMYFENIEFLRYAKSKGLKVIVDIYEQPSTYKSLAREIAAIPELQMFQYLIPIYEAKASIRETYITELLELADYYTLPSKCVEISLHEFASFDSRKAFILPYASSISLTKYNWHPVKHRLLFVGSDAINKGLIYCAKAATELKTKYPDLDFRVAGINPGVLDLLPPYNNLTFLGFLDKNQLVQEYCSAEAMVFPTLNEGFAGSVIEAAACGCPVITTENCGADRESFPALFVETRNVESIVDAVEKLFEEEDLGRYLSMKLYDYASSLDSDRYEKRLVEVINRI